MRNERGSERAPEGTRRLGGFWLLVAAAGLGAFAAPSVRAGSTADELARIEAEHVVLKAKLRLTETRAQIAARQAEIDRQTPNLQNGMPTVVGIEGMGRRMTATLATENGALIEVVVGDILPDGARVAAISATGVSVTTAGRRQVRLRAAGDAVELGRVGGAPVPGGRAAGYAGGGWSSSVPALMPMVPATPSVPPSPAMPTPLAPAAILPANGTPRVPPPGGAAR